MEIFNSNKLYNLTSREQLNCWWIDVIKNDNNCIIKTSSCLIKDGINSKVRISETIVSTGKNIGKKNETTVEEQAILEAKSKWNRKKDRNGMTEKIPKIEKNKINKSNTIIRPMLAHKYSDHSKKIKFPCYCQRKYDGIRHIICVRKKNNSIFTEGYSRTGKIKTFEKIEGLLKELFKNTNKEEIYFDGELYNHNYTFEQIQKCVSKKKNFTDEDLELISNLNYHIYDCFDVNNEKWIFEERNKFLQTLNFKDNLVLAETKLVNNENEMNELYKIFISEKYEGIMLRNKNGLYKKNYRSYDLQKHKPFLDDEFEIVGYDQAKGTHKGCVVWLCKSKNNNNTFKVVHKCSVDERKKLYKNGKNYIGKLLTVRYQELTQYGVPRFPVGICIRKDI